MRHLLQALQRSIAVLPQPARAALRTPHIYPSTAVQRFSSSPFHRLFARHAERLQNRHLLRFSRRWYTESSKATPKVTSNANAASSTGATASASSSSSSASSGQASLSLTARLRKLSREYGWSVFGVYMALTALDFPFCFLAVRWFGTERIGHWEHAAVEWLKRAIPFQWPEKWGGPKKEAPVEAPVDGVLTVYDHGVREAEAANRGDTASKLSY
jgi:Protein of unknown function (DUF1279)